MWFTLTKLIIQIYNLKWEEIRIKWQIKFHRIKIKAHNIIGFRFLSKFNCQSKMQWFHYNGTPPQVFPLKISETLRGYSKCIYAKSPEFGRWHLHFGTFAHIEDFHLLSPTSCLNHLQSPAFPFLMETKLPSRSFFIKKREEFAIDLFK